MSKLSKNIRHLRHLKQWSQEQLAAELGIPRARIGSYEEERCDPPIETVIKLSNLFHIAVDALVKCDLRQFDAQSFIQVAENRILFPIVVDHQNADQIEVVTMKASAGYLKGYADPEYIEQLPLMQLPFPLQGKLRAFPISGDSMPPLNEGCYVIGRFIESIRELKPGQTAVLVTKEDGLVYKRVYPIESGLELHSTNPVYAPYRVPASEILEAWQFVCSINTKDIPVETESTQQMVQVLQTIQADIRQLQSAIR